MPPSPLVDDELTLLLSDTHAAGPREKDALTYRFAMLHSENGARIGNLSVRIADSEYIVQYFGHIGYGVHPLFRGHRYAAAPAVWFYPCSRTTISTRSGSPATLTMCPRAAPAN